MTKEQCHCRACVGDHAGHGPCTLTSNPVSMEWRCFHCDEVFTDREAAADHFGVQIDGCADDVACKINATDGLLVSMLREAQADLRQYHQEDNAAFLQFHTLGAEHARALRREEEKGYARGLEDAKKHPESIGLRSADETTGWRPIETAPKGQVVLLGLPPIGALKDPTERRVYEGRWNEIQNTYTSVNGVILLSIATHWMPLPSAPSSPEEPTPKQSFVTYDKYGGVFVDLSAYLQTPEGKAQLDALTAVNGTRDGE